MAKRRINKSKKIREELESLGHDTPPKAVVAALAAKRVRVTVQQVSQAKLKRTASRANGSAKVDLDQLLAAKAFVARSGSIDAARKSLDGFAELIG